jgi:FkbM family methyltransferase
MNPIRKLRRWLHHQVRAVPWFGRLVLRLIPDVPWTIPIPGIGPFRIHLRRNRGYLLNDPLNHERFMLGALERAVRPGDVVFDVGANAGLYTRYICQCFKAGKVVAFEPVPDNRTHLKHNLRLGGILEQVQIVPQALAETEGMETFQKDDLTFASGTLDVVKRGAASQARAQYGFPPLTITVEVSRLDTLVESGIVPVPQVIKLDVEGAEAMVLRGSLNTLKAYKPILVIELHGVEVARTVVSLLWQAGYRVFGDFRENPHVVDNNYQEIGAAQYERIYDFYSLHHLIAGPDADRLSAPLLPFSPGAIQA